MRIIEERPMVFRKADERREDCSRLQGSGRLCTPSRPCTQVIALDRRPIIPSVFWPGLVGGGGGPNASDPYLKDTGSWPPRSGSVIGWPRVERSWDLMFKKNSLPFWVIWPKLSAVGVGTYMRVKSWQRIWCSHAPCSMFVQFYCIDFLYTVETGKWCEHDCWNTNDFTQQYNWRFFYLNLIGGFLLVQLKDFFPTGPILVKHNSN